MHDRINVGLVHDATVEDRFCYDAAMWAGGRIWERRGFTLDLIDPAALSLHSPLREDDEALPALQQRLARADGFIIVIPPDPRGIPPSLGSLIDCTDTQWREKPVGFLACGDLSGELPVIEQLRFVFAQLQAVTLADVVRLDHTRTRLDADGEPAASDPAYEAMDALLTQLHRQTLLRGEARLRQPCMEVAVRARPAPAQALHVKAGTTLQDDASSR